MSARRHRPNKHAMALAPEALCASDPELDAKRRALTDLVDALPTWRRHLVYEYGLAIVLRTDPQKPERAIAQCEAARAERQAETLALLQRDPPKSD